MREGASLDPSPTPGAGATALSVQYLPPLTQCTPLMRFVPLGVYTEDPSGTTDIEYFPALTEPLG
jgi:hypothetical protein